MNNSAVEQAGEWEASPKSDPAIWSLRISEWHALAVPAYVAPKIRDAHNAILSSLKAELAEAQKALLRIFNWAHSNRPYADVSKIEGNTLLQDIAEQGLGYWPAQRDERVVEEILSHRQQLAASQEREAQAYGRGVTAGKLEALRYTPQERENYGKWIEPTLWQQELESQLASAVKALEEKQKDLWE